MNIAFLIAAHTDLHQLLRLCKKLKDYGDAYIHVDKRVGIAFVDSLVKGLTSVKGQYETIVLSNRINVKWGGYSQVEGQLLLLEKLLASNKEYDRIFYISGLCYPLFSPERLRTFCIQNSNREFIKAFNITKGNDMRQLERIRLYHFFRDINLPHKSFVRRFIIGGSKFLLKYVGIRRKPYIKINDVTWDVYFSSSWVGLTNECAQYVLRTLKKHKELQSYFSSAYAPDELVIPTILFNSPFKERGYVSERCCFEELSMLHYLNYTDHIWTYDQKDYDVLMHSGKPFVRKLISEKSEKLIEQIDMTHKLA